MIPLLWLCGPSGVGKSSVGWEIHRLLGRTAFVDGDQIGLCYPGVAAHPLRAGNLAAMWPGFVAEGMRGAVLSGFLATSDEMAEYTRRIPTAGVTVCRLRVGQDELRRRFVARGWRPDLVEEALAEARELEESSVADVTVTTDGLTVAEAARAVLAATSWAPSPVAAPVEHARRTSPVEPASTGDLPVVWFSGATAVGKSTVAYALFTRIIRSGIRAAYVDLKQIGALDGASPDLRRRHLDALRARYRSAGARYLVVSGDATSPAPGAASPEPGAASPAPGVTTVHLHASPDTLTARVAERAAGRGPALPGEGMRGAGAEEQRQFVRRAVRENDLLDRATTPDLRLDTDGRTPEDLAEAVHKLL